MKNLHFEGDFFALKHIGNPLYFDKNGNLLLTTIGGTANFWNWEGSADRLTEIGGDANFWKWEGSADRLTEIGGDANFWNWTGSADRLTEIGGDANFEKWTGSAPKLTTIGGSANFVKWTGSAPSLTSIGRNAYFANWKGSAPLLSSRYKWAVAMGSREATIIYDTETGIFKTGCFSGNESELRQAIEKKHGNNQHAKNYIDFINSVTKK